MQSLTASVDEPGAGARGLDGGVRTSRWRLILQCQCNEMGVFKIFAFIRLD